MKTAEDIESYLIQMNAPYESVGEGIWLIKETGPDMVISMAESVLVFRVKVMAAERAPKERREELYRTLLELNASEMIHGAYGLEEQAVVVTAALQLENLDYNEFQSTLDDLGLAVSNHYPTLSKIVA